MRLQSSDSAGMTGGDGQPHAPATDGTVLRTLARVAVVRGRVAVERGLPVDAEADASLRLACDAARQSGFRAEQLVLMVKESWRSLAQPRERHEFDLALEKLVSLCIAEFYRAREGSLKISSVPNADRRGPALMDHRQNAADDR